MATKVDPSSSVEPHRGLSSVSASTSSSVSGGRPKISMFGTKSGFVIPKNKLTGSLVPKFRGGTKADSGNTQIKEESSRRVQRKTKWGPDLTQDAAVRKARALAYQTRVEQITQQQKSGALEIEDNEGSQLPELDSGQHSDSDRVNQKAKMYELLELEKRELIGEILRLNSNYKPPSDYKPLLKEGKVPIPVKAHPGYNFIGLLMGPESNTQKRLEEETGAKIRVYGTKTNTLEKREITQSDIAEAQGAYEELYVNISADSYEKVDAAVSLIELLVTPVSSNAAAAFKNSTSLPVDNSNEPASSYVATTVGNTSQVIPQLMLGTAHSNQFHSQPQFSAPWFQVGPPNAPPRLPTGFSPFPTPNNLVRFPPSPSGPPYFGQPTSFNRPQLQIQALSQPPPNQSIPSQAHLVPGQLAPPSSFSTSRPMLIGPNPPPPRPSGPMAQPLMSGPLLQLPAQRPNASQMAPQSNMHHNIARPLPSANFAPPATFPIRPTFGPVLVTPTPVVSSSSGHIPPPASVSSTIPSSFPRALPVASASMAPVPRPSPSLNVTVPNSVQAMSPSPSVVPAMSRPTVPSFSPANRSSPIPAPKPLLSRSGDFTFQPRKAQVPPSPTIPRPNSPSIAQNFSPLPLVPPQPPSFRPVSPNPTPQVGPQGFQAPPQSPSTFPSANIQPPPRFPLPSSNVVLPMAAQTVHIGARRSMGPPSFSPAPRGYIAGQVTPVGGNQVYDPFSPTSISSASLQQGGEVRRPENDAEYEDLMASVGVK